MENFLDYTAWLYTRVYQNSFFFIDLWSVVHCWSGFIVFFIFLTTRVKRPLTALFFFLFAYEVVEIIVAWLALGIFKPETFKDQLTDLFIGMLGGYIGQLIVYYFEAGNKNHRDWLKIFSFFLTAITYAFLWVGFYHYQYNVAQLNSEGINWYAFSWWAITVFIMVYAFEYIRIRYRLLKLLVTWAGYFIVLLVSEFIGYRVIGIHEISKPDATPLLFGLVHGTPVMHWMYSISPFISVVLFLLINGILTKGLACTIQRKSHSAVRAGQRVEEENSLEKIYGRW